MQQFRYIFVIIIATFFLAGVFTMSSAQSLFNHEINYQGKLTNSSGVPVADGVYHMTFRLYTTATSATTTNIWEEDRSTAAGNRITVTGGLFSVLLGSSTPLTSVSFNQTLYLGVEIGGLAASPSWDGEMTPRKKLGAVPAAFEAEKFGGLATTSFLRSDAVNSTSTSSTFLTATNNGTGNIAVFTGSGNVGVGTTSPYAKLSVWGAGIDGAKVFEIANNASTTLMSMLESGTGYFLGNIGIGTTSPASKLQVTGSASSAVGGISVNDTTSNYNIGGLYHDSGTSRTTLYDANPSGPGFDFKLFGVAGIPSNVGAYSQKLSLGTNFFGGSKYWGFDATNQNNTQAFSMKSDASDINLFSGSGYAIKIFPAGTNTSDPVLTATSTGVGIGTTTPYSKLTVWGTGTGTGQVFEIINNASTTLARFLDNGTGYFLGNIGIGTTTPYAKLSVVGEAVASYFTATSTTATSTIAGDVNVGSGSLTYINSSGVTSISNLTMGAQSFESDAGIVSWADMPVSSASTGGTVESYSAQMAGNPLLTVYGEALGASGGVWHDGVGIGTTTPFARLSIVGVATTSASARPLFDIASTSGASFLRMTAFGNLGIGTTTPQWLLHLASSTAPQLALSDGSLTSNHWTFRNAGGNLYVATSSPSTFATSSMSALVVNTNGYLGIATTSPWAKLSVNGTVAMSALGTSQGNAICVTAGGEITNPGSAVCTGSSERFKENIETIAPGYALDELSKLRAVSFDYKEGFYSPEDLKGSYGMIAEEVEKIDPKLVDYGYDKKPMTLKFEKFTGLLVQAVVELSDALKALVARVTGLEEKLNAQQEEIDALKRRVNALDGQAAAAVVSAPPSASGETVSAAESEMTVEPGIVTAPEASAEPTPAPAP
jgi:hypothetical protein